MKLILENWRQYLEESEQELLDEAVPKWLQKALGTAALGTALGGSVGAAAGLAGAGGQNVDTELAIDQEDTGDTGVEYEAPKMPTSGEFAWSKAPTGGGLIWVSPEQISDDYIMPSRQQTAGSFRDELRNAKIGKKGTDKWTVKDLERMLFSNQGAWAYSQAKGQQAFDVHPEIKASMLPPAWAIAFQVYAEKVEKQIDSILQRPESEQEIIAGQLGLSSIDQLYDELLDIKKSVTY